MGISLFAILEKFLFYEFLLEIKKYFKLYLK